MALHIIHWRARNAAGHRQRQAPRHYMVSTTCSCKWRYCGAGKDTELALQGIRHYFDWRTRRVGISALIPLLYATGFTT